MVLATHAIWSAYWFWLPNEPRGSWSTKVWASQLRHFGPATKTNLRRSLANEPYDRDVRREMRESLRYPAVRFNLKQIESIAGGFARAVEQFNIVLLACAILWDHVHIVAATRQLSAEGSHPLTGYARPDGTIPTPWVEGGWNRFLNSELEIVDAIDYVVKNPEKVGLRAQSWAFVRARGV